VWRVATRWTLGGGSRAARAAGDEVGEDWERGSQMWVCWGGGSCAGEAGQEGLRTHNCRPVLSLCTHIRPVLPLRTHIRSVLSLRSHIRPVLSLRTCISQMLSCAALCRVDKVGGQEGLPAHKRALCHSSRSVPAHDLDPACKHVGFLHWRRLAGAKQESRAGKSWGGCSRGRCWEGWQKRQVWGMSALEEPGPRPLQLVPHYH